MLGNNENDFVTEETSAKGKWGETLKEDTNILFSHLYAFRRGLIVLGIVAIGGYALYQHPPWQKVEQDEIGLRINQWTGETSRFREGSVLVIPGLHEMRNISLRDRIYHPSDSFQSVEGLSIGADITVRYTLDPDKIPTMAQALPEDISGEVAEPIIREVLYRTFSRYTVREIFSTKRQEIHTHIAQELNTRLVGNGIRLKLLTIGKIDLPADYKAGMEKLLAMGLETEQMRYTLELKDKRIRETELEAQAEKVRREKIAEAASEEQIIAAKAQAEAMKHILPFKEKQIQQRTLEAEADKAARLKRAEADAQARRIEAEAEADSRKKLADAEIYRQDRLGKVSSEQLARDGAILTQSPLLIQKTLADKLSDKISVIVVPPSTNGGFIGENLIGRLPAPAASSEAATQRAVFESTGEE